MPEYKSKYTGAEIDALLDKVDGRTSTPAPAEDKLITSGGVYTGLAGKTDKVTSPTAGNLPKLKADGSLEDSGKKPSDFVEKEAGKGLSTNDYTNEDKTKLGALPTKADLDTELDAKEDKDNKVTSFSNPTDTQYPSAKLVSDSLNKVKADVSALLTRAGIAEGIADTISAGTAQEFLQRQSGGDGVNCIKRINGKTIVWNQLSNVINFTNAQYDTRPNLALWAQWLGVGGVVRNDVLDSTLGPHSFLLTAPASVSTMTFKHNGQIQDLQIFSHGTTAGHKYVLFYNVIKADPTVVGGIEVDGVQFHDLTLLGLGDLTAEQFKARYPKLDYAYIAAVLKNNDAAALLTDGRNQWDEVAELGTLNTDGTNYPSTASMRTQNFVPVIGNMSYCLTYKDVPFASRICFYDINKTFISNVQSEVHQLFTFTTPANAAYIRVAFLSYAQTYPTYNHDICINLSDPSFNGTYQPYWKRVLALRISELTGIPEGGTEADRVTMFPNGAGGAGSAFDSLFVENGVTKARKMMRSVDLGDLDWTYSPNTATPIFSVPISDLGCKSNNTNMISPLYTTMSAFWQVAGQDRRVASGEGNLNISNSAYTDAATFKAAMAGVYLEYELATPIVYTDLQYADGTPFTMPATILVDIGGVERVISPTHADGSPSAPFCCDSNYSISIKRLVDIINSLN